MFETIANIIMFAILSFFVLGGIVGLLYLWITGCDIDALENENDLDRIIKSRNDLIDKL